MSRNLACAVSLMLLVLAASPAYAYVGPGAGLSMLGALWGLLVAVLAAIAFVLAWPVRRYLRRRRGSGSGESSAARPGAERTSDEHAREASADSQGRS